MIITVEEWSKTSPANALHPMGTPKLSKVIDIDDLSDVGESAMPHFSVAQKGDLTRGAEDIFSWNLIANSSRQGRVSSGS